MDAKELRIGNLINYAGLTIVNSGIINEIFRDGKESYSKPIELTEDWLIKFGFKKSTKLYEIYLFTCEKLQNIELCGFDDLHWELYFRCNNTLVF